MYRDRVGGGRGGGRKTPLNFADIICIYIAPTQAEHAPAVADGRRHEARRDVAGRGGKTRRGEPYQPIPLHGLPQSAAARGDFGTPLSLQM